MSILKETKEGEHEVQQEAIVLASFARSGNTFSRGYLERVTSLITGSDGMLNLGLVKYLKE